MNYVCFYVHDCDNLPVVYVRSPSTHTNGMIWPICEEHAPRLEEGEWESVSAEEFTMRVLTHDIEIAQPSRIL